MKLTSYGPDMDVVETFFNPIRALREFAYQLEIVRTAEAAYPCGFTIGFTLSLFGFVLVSSF